MNITRLIETLSKMSGDQWVEQNSCTQFVYVFKTLHVYVTSSDGGNEVALRIVDSSKNHTTVAETDTKSLAKYPPLSKELQKLWYYLHHYHLNERLDSLNLEGLGE